MPFETRLPACALSLLLPLLCAPALAQEANSMCGSLNNSFGPFDYRADHFVPSFGDQMPLSEKKFLVEGAHFTPRVEQLIGAQTHSYFANGSKAPPGHDIDYTLRAFPNHPRALVAVMRYGEKYHTDLPPDLPLVVECYFERAIRFAPDDVIVRMLYATYLISKDRQPEAARQLVQVEKLAGDEGFTFYNAGKIYFNMKMYPQAAHAAQRALELGFTRPDLSDQLKSIGAWPPAPASSEATASAGSASAPTAMPVPASAAASAP